jgi:SynChlorMet cassette protein ScmC
VPACGGYALALADGSRYVIRAADADAERVVQAFAAAAALGLAGEEATGRTVLAVSTERITSPVLMPANPALPLVCPVHPPTGPNQLAIAMTNLTLAIARDVQARGGLLLHAALATWPAGGERLGVVFAAPGATGKSTTSRRLPPPWRSLCDDTTLVVRDGCGHYWAHPVPTWSRFYSYTGAVGGTWDMAMGVPLQAVFFLSQAADVAIERLASRTCTAALLAESAEQVGQMFRRRLPPDEAEAFNRERLANVAVLAQAVPAWRLEISLNGAFWNPVERVLAGLDRRPGSDRPPAAAPPRTVSGVPDTLFVVYTGPSMNPTLVEPDMLEVMPYAGRSPRVGDVVYFVPGTTGRGVVHRVVAVTPHGLRTRGDHNQADDTEPVLPAEVVGQVVMAHRGTRRRAIAGGWRGQVDRVAAHGHRLAVQLGACIAGGLYRAVAPWAAGCLPCRLRPRMVRFAARGREFDKLLLAGHIIGHYDLLRRRWVIRFPFRLLVDAGQLPQPGGVGTARPTAGVRPE